MYQKQFAAMRYAQKKNRAASKRSPPAKPNGFSICSNHTLLLYQLSIILDKNLNVVCIVTFDI